MSRGRRTLQGSRALGFTDACSESSKRSLLTKLMKGGQRMTGVTQSALPTTRLVSVGRKVKTGKTCYVMDLTLKHTSNYLIKGTLWLDPVSYRIVRLDGWTSSSVSMWVGTTRILRSLVEVRAFGCLVTRGL